MNFKKYHVSKNLYVDKIDNAIINSSGIILSRATDNYNLYIAPVIAGETYSLDDSLYYGFFASYPQVGDTTYNGSREKYDKFIAPITGYVAVRYDISVNTPMINEGPTPLPYEPYSSEVWHDSHYIMGTATDTLTTLPAVLYPNATTATVGLKGNTVQNGAPTPQNPVMPNGVGERTGNLVDMSTVENGKGIATDGSIINYEKRCSTVTPIDVSAYSNVTLAFTAALSRTRVIYALFNDSTLVTRQTAVYSGTMIDVSSGNKLYICFYDAGDTERVQKSDLSNVMLNRGSTDLPYEPYGYKIPISSASTTTPVYLGEVETTRRVKKMVLDGTEDWTLSYGSFRINVPDYYRRSGWIPICTHYQGVNSVAGGGDLTNGQVAFLVSASANYYIYICDTNCTSAADFKAYLAQQYANGTPVTVWYVLAEPETGIINEPIRKIGDYADTVSGITIPTIAGANSFDVLTTLKPSEVTVSYTGWHTGAVHGRENGAWTE